MTHKRRLNASLPTIGGATLRFPTLRFHARLPEVDESDFEFKIFKMKVEPVMSGVVVWHRTVPEGSNAPRCSIIPCTPPSSRFYPRSAPAIVTIAVVRTVGQGFISIRRICCGTGIRITIREVAWATHREMNFFESVFSFVFGDGDP